MDQKKLSMVIIIHMYCWWMAFSIWRLTPSSFPPNYMCIVFEGYGVPIFKYFILYFKLISYIYAAEYPVNGGFKSWRKYDESLNFVTFHSMYCTVQNSMLLGEWYFCKRRRACSTSTYSMNV
jgi:hypothetical protein